MFSFYTSPDFDLRLLEPRHAEELFTLVDADRAYFGRFLDFPSAMTTVEATRDYLKKMMYALADCGAPYLGIYHQGVLAGAVGLNPHIRWDSRSGEIFYYIGERFQGQGLVTRSSRVVINNAFAELNLHRITLWAAAGNTRSWAVAERLGFHRDGVHRDSKWLGDHYDDHYVYSLLRSEWEQNAAYREVERGNLQAV